MPQRWQWYKPHLFTPFPSTNNFYTIGRADSEICIIGREKRILTPVDRYSGILITKKPILKKTLKILCIIILLTLPCYWCLTSNIQQRAWKELLGSLYERQDLNNKNEKANGWLHTTAFTQGMTNNLYASTWNTLWSLRCPISYL